MTRERINIYRFWFLARSINADDADRHTWVVENMLWLLSEVREGEYDNHGL
jgi:hypothetical protein